MLSNLTVLYVEDNQIARSVVGEFLEDRVGFLDVAHDGKEALEKFKNGNFDLIITDLRMPNMDGIAFMQEVKKINASMEIIVVSAFKDEKEDKECEKLGVFEFLKKPLDLDELQNVLSKVASKIESSKR